MSIVSDRPHLHIPTNPTPTPTPPCIINFCSSTETQTFFTYFPENIFLSTEHTLKQAGLIGLIFERSIAQNCRVAGTTSLLLQLSKVMVVWLVSLMFVLIFMEENFKRNWKVKSKTMSFYGFFFLFL